MVIKNNFKLVVAFWTVFYLSTPSNGIKIGEKVLPEKFDIPSEWGQKFYNSLGLKEMNMRSTYSEGYIMSNVNDFADQILRNIGVFSVNNSLDPMPIDGFEQGFLTAHVSLENGTLNGISTISRNGDVNVKYSFTTKVVDLDIPIMFDNIGFSYHYHVIIFRIGPEGTMIGKIQNCKVFVCLSFDFNTYVATVKKLQMMDSGHASLTFVGGVIELVIDVLSEFLSVILHPFIIAIIQGVVQGVSNLICTTVNDAINGTFMSPDEAALNATNLTQWIV